MILAKDLQKEKQILEEFSLPTLNLRFLERDDFKKGFNNMTEIMQLKKKKSNKYNEENPWDLQGFFKDIKSKEEFEAEYDFLYPA